MRTEPESSDKGNEELRAWMLDFQARHSLRSSDMARLLRRTPEWYSRLKKSGPVPEILIDYLRLIDALPPEQQILILQGQTLPPFEQPKTGFVPALNDNNNLDQRASSLAARFLNLITGRTEQELDRLDNQIHLMEMKAGVPREAESGISTGLKERFSA
jgi:hypothetical protein